MQDTGLAFVERRDPTLAQELRQACATAGVPVSTLDRLVEMLRSDEGRKCADGMRGARPPLAG